MIVDSQHQEDFQDLQNTRSTHKIHDPILQDVLDKAHGMTTPIALSQTIDGESIVGITPISGTDWYFVTIYPKHLIAQQAMIYTLGDSR